MINPRTFIKEIVDFLVFPEASHVVIYVSTCREVERVPDIQSLTFADALMAWLKRVPPAMITPRHFASPCAGSYLAEGSFTIRHLAHLKHLYALGNPARKLRSRTFREQPEAAKRLLIPRRDSITSYAVTSFFLSSKRLFIS